jgi:predicted aspartyl protease
MVRRLLTALRRGLGVVAVGGVLTLAPATPASAELYRWTDGDGVVHYTTDLASIPEAYRADASALEHPKARGAPPSEPEARGLVVPFAAGGPIIVPGLLNGVTLSLLVDTGADRTLLSPSALARAGFGGQDGSPIQILGVTGSGAATLVTVPRLDIAGARLGPLRVVVHPAPADGVDGLLGRDVLDAFTLTVDAASGRATLVPR